jgi:DNA-binding beta-propeller fold protein YncE
MCVIKFVFMGTHVVAGMKKTFILAFTVPWICCGAELLRSTESIVIARSSGDTESLVVDAERRRLLMARPQDGALSIVDLRTDSLSKVIKTGAAQDIAVDREKNRYYVSVSREKKLVIISRETLDITGEVSLPNFGGRLCVAPKGVNRVFVGYKTGSSLWVVDPFEKKIVTTLPVSKGPQFLVAEDDTSRVYQNIASDHTVLVISASDGNSTVGGAWPTAPAKLPQGIALDLREPRRLFVAGFNGKLAVMNAGDGNLIGSVDIAPEVRQIAFDQERQRLYCPGNKGSMTIVDAKGQATKVLGTVPIDEGVKAVAVDPVTHAVWIAYPANGISYARKFAAGE